MAQELLSQDHAPEARPPEGQEQLAWVDLSPLSSDEILALHRYARESEPEPELEHRIDNVLDYVVELSPERAKELFAAYIDSPLHSDREMMMFGINLLYDLTKIDHDSGVLLLDRLVRDRNKKIRYQSAQGLRRRSMRLLTALPSTTTPTRTFSNLPTN